MRDKISTSLFYSFHCNTLIAKTTMFYLQKEEEGFDHQIAKMPPVPSPDTVTIFSTYMYANFRQRIVILILTLIIFQLLSMEDLRERRITDPALPR